LVAVDFSDRGRGAFDHALALSRLHEAELLAVHAVPTDRRFNWHARKRIALIGALRHAAEKAGVRFKVSVQHGDPAGVILLHATARRADLIVLGASERSGLDRFRFGSVAETVALAATQPVLVVPPTSGTPADSMTTFENILVAVDFGEASTETVERALSMANESGRVTVMHVVRGVPFERSLRYPHHLMEPEYQRLLARDAWRRIATIIPTGTTTSPKIHARVVTGDPSKEISRVAADIDADLILIGVTPRGALGRMIFGSTAARVIRSARRPVLAIPKHSEPAVVPVSDEDQFAVAA
jgi:universal stress protein A